MTRSKLLALLLSLALTAVASLIPPQASAAPCRCLASIHRTTTAACSAGSCSEAESCLYDYLSTFVSCGADGTCYENLVITQSCFQPGPGSYQVNGYLEYRCSICF